MRNARGIARDARGFTRNLANTRAFRAKPRATRAFYQKSILLFVFGLESRENLDLVSLTHYQHNPILKFAASRIL